MTRTQRRFSQEAGWWMVWSPPLEPDCQPIEILWGMVKNHVAYQYTVGRCEGAAHNPSQSNSSADPSTATRCFLHI